MDIKTTLAALEESYSEIIPEIPFEYGFVDEDYDRMYRVIERMGVLFNYLSILAIFVSCLGLFGLASYITEKRTKEMASARPTAHPLRISCCCFPGSS